MSKDIVFHKNPDFVTRVIEGETMLMPIYKTSEEINCIYTLNDCASSVWEMIDGKKPLAEIKKNIQKEFDSTQEEIEKELGNLLKDLESIKAIERK